MRIETSSTVCLLHQFLFYDLLYAWHWKAHLGCAGYFIRAWLTIRRDQKHCPSGSEGGDTDSAQNLTAITDNWTTPKLLIITDRHTLTPTLQTDGCTTGLLHKTHAHKTNYIPYVNILKMCLHRHRSSSRDLPWLVSASGSRWPSSATLVIQCPEPLPPRYCYNYTWLHCCGHLCTSAAATVTALATGTFNTVATSTAGSCYTLAVNATVISG